MAENLIIHSYAKLNLFLAVLGKREDGYHRIKTIFERINLADKLVLKPLKDDCIRIVSSRKDLPKDSSNLAYRSAQLLKKTFNIDKGVQIDIEKNIPIGAGLGGGSSNAAAALLGLNSLWKLNLSKPKLASFARKIGSDVPFFVYEVNFAQGLQRGDIIRPLTSMKNIKFWHVVAVPPIHVSTPFVYGKWDRKMSLKSRVFRGPKVAKDKKSSELTKTVFGGRILSSRLKKNAFYPGCLNLFNDLEEITMNLYPQVQRIKELMTFCGVKSVLMSGSGPAVFGIVSSRKEAMAAAEKMKKEDSLWRIFVTSTV